MQTATEKTGKTRATIKRASMKEANIRLIKDQFRGDYEILDDQERCRGFIWKFKRIWVVHVDDLPAQQLDRYAKAVALARELITSELITSEPAAQPVDDLEAAAQQLAAYVRKHAVPLNKMENRK